MIFGKRFLPELRFLLVTCLLFFLLRFPSLYEPYWYGDEGIYFTIGRALRSGRELYTGIWDNKPPLLYWIYTICNDIFSVRFASLCFGLAAVIAFYFLSQLLFTKRWVSYLTTALFALCFALPTFEGNIANAENFLLFPVITAAYFFLRSVKEHERDRSLLLSAGLLLGTAFLIKTVAIFDLAAFISVLFFLKTENRLLQKDWRLFSKSSLPLVIGFVTPFILLSLLFLIKGILPEFLLTIFSKNAGYVGERNSFIIPQGYLIMKCLLLAAGLGLIFFWRKKLSFPLLFTLTWLAFSLFNAYFSQRPYIHYQLVLLPAFVLAIGLLASLPKKHTVLLAMLLCGIFIQVWQSFPHWKSNNAIPYYQNFISFMLGEKSMTAYQRFFDTNTPDDYALADYLRLHTTRGENVFLWGNSAQIYYLSGTLPSGRYAVAYHIVSPDTIAETLHVLKKEPPKFVMIMPGTEPFPFPLPDYVYRATIAGSTVYEKLN